MEKKISHETLLEEIRLLKEERDSLREEVRQLKAMLVPKEWEPPLEFNLTPKEKVVFAALYRGEGIITKRKLMDTVYSYDNGTDPAMPKILDVFICKIRKKIAPFDLTIETEWGVGYFLTEASKEKLSNWDKPLLDSF